MCFLQGFFLPTIPNPLSYLHLYIPKPEDILHSRSKTPAIQSLCVSHQDMVTWTTDIPWSSLFFLVLLLLNWLRDQESPDKTYQVNHSSQIKHSRKTHHISCCIKHIRCEAIALPTPNTNTRQVLIILKDSNKSYELNSSGVTAVA